MEPISEVGGIPLGLLANMGYDGSCAQLEPGDALFLYTDGVPEAENAALDQFTYERLAASLRESTSLPCREMIDRPHPRRVGLHRRRPTIRRYHHALHPQGTVIHVSGVGLSGRPIARPKLPLLHPIGGTSHNPGCGGRDRLLFPPG